MTATGRWMGFAAYTALLMPGAAMAAEPLRNLPAAEKPRFVVTDRTWPSEIGQASVCLWSDDHLAALSITIDDNWTPDHAWWIETGKTYGMRFTWFVIAGNLSPRGGLFGTPEDFAKLRAAGHDVQSHTVDHFGGRTSLGVIDTETNYRLAIEMLEKEIPGARVIALAYPGGANAKNDRSLAEKYYIAARGTRGHLNSANQVDYMDTNSLSASMPLDADHYAGFPNLITLNPKRASVYRGWASVHFHGLDNPKQPTGETKRKIIEVFDYVRANGDAFWVAPFAEVAQYGQERDTASLVVRKGEDGACELDLTDGMDDRWFTFPLTIKLRVADGWSKLDAQQNDRAVPSRLVENEGGRYALIQAVPDAGTVSVRGE